MSANSSLGHVYTVDRAGVAWCLQSTDGRQGSVIAVRCAELGRVTRDASGHVYNFNWAVKPGHASESVVLALGGNSDGYALALAQAELGSGPLPHHAYTCTCGRDNPWNWTSRSGPGGQVRLLDGASVYDNDNVGRIGIRDSGGLCLTLSRFGDLEVWTAPLTGERIAVALFNRASTTQSMSVGWDLLGLAPQSRMAVRDVWRAQNSIAVGSWTDPEVPAKGVTLLVLAPKG